MKRVIFDVDGVLADFIGGFTAQLALNGADVKPYSTYEQKVWDFEFDRKLVQQGWELVKENPRFWVDLEPLVTVAEMERIVELADKEEVYFVTAREGQTVKKQTEEWLMHHGVWNPTVIISPNKGEVADALTAEFLIDDKAGNCIYTAYQAPTRVFCIDRQYNRFDPKTVGARVERVKTVGEFLNVVEG